MRIVIPPDKWKALNEEFYAGDPAEYFRIRLSMLILAAGAPDEVQRLLESGVRYDGMVTMTLGRSTEQRSDAAVAYLIAESQALLHHVSEALLRLFLGHAAMAPCPWIEVASERDFAKFKREVAAMATQKWPEELAAAVSDVFLGPAPREPGDSLDESLVAVTRLLRHLATELIQGANLYNAIKHGMAIIGSQDAYVTIAEDGAAPFMGSRGPSASFLESKVSGDQRVWKVTQRWLSIRRAMWLSQLALVEIDALWAIARARYLGAELSGVHVVTAESVEEGITGTFADAGGLKSFSRTVAVEQHDSPRRGRGRRPAR